jgi:hypothetical protein
MGHTAAVDRLDGVIRKSLVGRLEAFPRALTPYSGIGPRLGMKVWSTATFRRRLLTR